MHKSECKSCKTAKEMIARYDEMIMDNQSPSIKDMADYNTAMQFYQNMTADHTWKGYNRDVKGAIYPQDLIGHELTEVQAKNWVADMHHKTMSGEIVRGEKWNMATTTKVLEDNGMVFTEDCRPIEGYIAMHCAWHDFYKSAYNAGMENEPKFYVSLATDILEDDDAKHSPKQKMYIKHYMCSMM